ncbi:MAG: hypothetical protein JWR90_1009 [Marmoricola sp.]|nr:hypothetical protein [Marmoricola sp.]
MEPDLIGLQEWYPSRVGLLRETGPVGPVPSAGILRLRQLVTSEGAYQWNVPVLGGCAVGARVERFELQRCWVCRNWALRDQVGSEAQSAHHCRRVGLEQELRQGLPQCDQR